jgi:hypothetical protein
VPDADLGVLVRAPNDAVAADIIERKNPTPSVVSPTSLFQTKNPRAKEPGRPLRRPGISIRRSSSARNTNMLRSLA